MSLAVFVPITRKTYILFSESDEAGFAYVKQVIKATLPIFFVGAFIFSFWGRDIISLVYPNYNVHNSLVWGHGIAIALLPLFFMLGNILAAKRINNSATLIMIGWYVAGWGLASITNLPELSFPLMILGSSLVMSALVFKLKKDRAHV